MTHPDWFGRWPALLPRDPVPPTVYVAPDDGDWEKPKFLLKPVVVKKRPLVRAA